MKVQDLVDQINEVFEGDPWYGNSISKYLQEIEPEWLNKHHNNGHSIGQIITHMITWREYVIDKLMGVENETEVGGTKDWEKAKAYSNNDKNELFARFKSTQKMLVQLLSEKEDSFLDEPVPGKPFKFEKLLMGIIQHDIYHLGQIYLLKPAPGKKTSVN